MSCAPARALFRTCCRGPGVQVGRAPNGTGRIPSGTASESSSSASTGPARVALHRPGSVCPGQLRLEQPQAQHSVNRRRAASPGRGGTILARHRLPFRVGRPANQFGRAGPRPRPAGAARGGASPSLASPHRGARPSLAQGPSPWRPHWRVPSLSLLASLRRRPRETRQTAARAGFGPLILRRGLISPEGRWGDAPSAGRERARRCREFLPSGQRQLQGGRARSPQVSGFAHFSSDCTPPGVPGSQEERGGGA